MMKYEKIDTPIGEILVMANEQGALTHLYTSGHEKLLAGIGGAEHDPEALAEAVRQLREYFAGERKTFDIPLAPTGTDFQKRVWAALVEIPYGETRTYGQLAIQLGTPSASRAVGRANATNPISIIVPCHRVIGSSGALTGYAGGLPTKQRLLEHEGVILGLGIDA